MSQTSSIPAAISNEDRYSRQILFPGIGASGQQKLASAHVAVVGVGATGAASASLLARAGVGSLTLIDRDFVEPSNLQRQVLFDEADALESLPKAEAARRKIALFNSGVAVHAHVADLVPANIAELLDSADIVLDATDNFETRYLLNDYAVRQAKPWIYAAAIGAYAATMNIVPGSASSHPTACLACLFPKPPTGPVETCDTSGILATAVNFAASISPASLISCAGLYSPSTCGRANAPKFQLPSPVPDVPCAASGSSPISRVRAALTSPSAVETQSRFMSITVPSTSLPCAIASLPTDRSGSTIFFSASSAAPTP
jgi:molybdopterin/thiamine biosynthesis adenylyltransferase